MQACVFCSVSALDLQAESEGFSHFHLYVCAAFLIKWRKEILSKVEFQVLTISCVTATGLREAACVVYMWPYALPTHACITGKHPGRHLPRDYQSNWPSSGAASAVTEFHRPADSPHLSARETRAFCYSPPILALPRSLSKDLHASAPSLILSFIICLIVRLGREGLDIQPFEHVFILILAVSGLK